MAGAMAQSNEIYKTMDLALRIGELLLAAGAGAADVTAQMNNVGRACGLRSFSVDVTFTELAMSHQAKPDRPALIQIRQVRNRQVDFGDLTLVDRLVRQLVAGRIDRERAATALNRIVSSRHGRPRWAVMLALGFVGAGVATMIQGTWLVLAIAWVAACCIDAIQRYMTQRRWPVFYQQVAGGLLATLLAAAVTAIGVDIGPSRVITASIILLLAGVSFLGAIQDALTGFPLTAVAKIFEAIIATAGIIGGVSAGLTLARVLGVGLGHLDPGAIRFASIPLAALGGALAAAGYAYSCYAPLRSVLPIAVISAAGTALYVAVYVHGISIAWSSALAALMIGLVSFAAAGRFRVPALVIVTSAIVPMLPGLSIYRALALFGDGRSEGLLALANAAAITIALSAGVILGQYVAQPLRREARKLESRLAGPRLVGPMSVRTARRRRSGPDKAH